MVKLVCVFALAAAQNPVSGALNWAEPAFSLWSNQVKEFLRFEADTITETALAAVGHQSRGDDPYAGIADADKAKVSEAFVPKCAVKLEELAYKLDAPARARNKDPSPTLGVSMATVIHVHCEYLPIDETECDNLGSELKRVVDAGHPLNPFKNETKAALLARKRDAPEEAMPKDPAPTGEVLADGGKWCEAFFDKFYDGLVKKMESAAGDEAEKEGLLLMHKFSRKATVQAPDSWSPMRVLLNHEVASITQLAKAKRGVKEAYAKAADADNAKVKEAFQPLCADKLLEVQTNMLDNAANREMRTDTMVGRELLGLSMSTHLQVQCSTADFPLSEEECDLSATELYRLVEAGNPLQKPAEKNATNETLPDAAAPAEAAAEAPAALTQVKEEPAAEEAPAEEAAAEGNSTKPEGPTIHEHGEEWCGVFFDRFFKAILTELESKEGGDEAAAELLQKLHPVLRRVTRSA